MTAVIKIIFVCSSS